MKCTGGGFLFFPFTAQIRTLANAFETVPRAEVARDVEGSEKGFCGCASGERAARGDRGLKLNGVGDLMSKG